VSSTTGKAYLIRFKDGKEFKSRDYLLGELKKLDAAMEDRRKKQATDEPAVSAGLGNPRRT